MPPEIDETVQEASATSSSTVPSDTQNGSDDILNKRKGHVRC